ncbi:MAG: hypothetical protein V4685_03595, partial [Bacteroidota bacterium]
ELETKGSNLSTGESWNFLQIKNYMDTPVEAKKIEPLLKAARKKPFKVLKISTVAKVVMAIIILLIGTPLIYFIYKFWGLKITAEYEFTVKTIVTALILFIIGLIFKPLAKYIHYKSAALRTAGSVALMILLWIVFNFYLWIFNDMYNKAGKLKK